MKTKIGFLLVISGPSGAGKGTILEALLKRFPDMSLIVSWTTRDPRQGEKDGVDYHFVSKEDFQQKVQEKAFLEWAMVYNEFYGTPMADVKSLIAQGKKVVLEIDVQGARSIRTNPLIDEVSLFIVPPNAEMLAKRLRERGTENNDKLEVRLKESLREIEEARYFDYIIINDDLETAINDAESAIRGECHSSRWVFDCLMQDFRKKE